MLSLGEGAKGESPSKGSLSLHFPQIERHFWRYHQQAGSVDAIAPDPNRGLACQPVPIQLSELAGRTVTVDMEICGGDRNSVSDEAYVQSTHYLSLIQLFAAWLLRRTNINLLFHIKRHRPSSASDSTTGGIKLSLWSRDCRSPLTASSTLLSTSLHDMSSYNQRQFVMPQPKSLRFARESTVRYYSVESEQNLVGRIVELDHDNLRYTIRRESGFLETVDDHNVLGSQAIY